MSGRTTLAGNAMPGGRIEYRGDLPDMTPANLQPLHTTSVGKALRVPGSTNRTRSAVVSSKPRNFLHSFFSHGAVEMRRPVPGKPGYGSVISSAFQRLNIQWLMWQLSPSLFEAGYPQNLGLSTAVPQPETNATGGPGRSVMTQRGLFDRVQRVQRPRAQVNSYATRGQ